MVVPCALIFVLAFFERGIYGGVDWSHLTSENFTRAIDPLYATIFLDSARIALIATLLALLIGYPAAYAIVKAPERWQTSLLFFAILPFWTNYLIRTYAWIVLLNPAGLINNALVASGLTAAPLSLLYNEFAVILGLVYNYTPFVILAIYSALQRLDPPLPKPRAISAHRQPPPSGASPCLSRLLVWRPAPSLYLSCRSAIRDTQSAGRQEIPDGRQPDL